MPYDVNIAETEGVLRVEVKGERSADTEKAIGDISSVWRRVGRECLTRHIDRVLAVFELTGPFSIVGAYRVASQPEKFEFDSKTRIAIADLDDESFRNNKFSETVAVNRGWQIKVFDNERDALEWLRR